MKVKCIKRYSDICLKEIVEKGTVLEVTENRGAHLISEGVAEMPHIGWDWEGGSIKIGNFKFSLPRFNLKWYANGGFPGMGEMFVARESGPELVGRMGNRSAVANNNQIIAGIRAGVFEAVVNAFESMQGRNDRGQELHIYLEGDAKKLFKVIRQEGNNYQKQTGNPVFG